MTSERIEFPARGDWLRARPVLIDLKQFLTESAFEHTSRLPLPGGPLDLFLDPSNIRGYRNGQGNLFHRSSVASVFRRTLASKHPVAVTLHELFTLGQTRELASIKAIIPPSLLRGLVDIGALTVNPPLVRSEILAVMVDANLFLSDPIRLQRHPDYVYLGRTSFEFSGIGARTAGRDRGADAPATRLLDLGCGAGIGAVSAAAEGVGEVLGTDIIERCLDFARLNAAINEVMNAEFRYSDICDQVDGDFDAIISNTPCAWEALEAHTFATGGAEFGTELPMRMLDAALDRLRAGGTVAAIVAAPIVHGEPYVLRALERLGVGRTLDVDVQPLFSEYDYQHSGLYRRHAITEFVRYRVEISKAETNSTRMRAQPASRFGSSRLRRAPR